MNDEQFMYVLEAVAYISATLAAFVYVWETCNPRRRRFVKNRSSTSIINEDRLIKHSSSSSSSNGSRKGSSSLYEEF